MSDRYGVPFGKVGVAVRLRPLKNWHLVMRLRFCRDPELDVAPGNERTRSFWLYHGFRPYSTERDGTQCLRLYREGWLPEEQGPPRR